MTLEEIISLLPYQEPFLFVDELISASEEGVQGSYTFDENAFFYQGHFKNNPITPGVILTETMAQIGLVCLGIYLMKEEITKTENIQIALTSHQIDFFIPVKPGESVSVISEKVYFRFHKLKCKVKMFNTNDDLVCRGTIAGMIKLKENA
jgi:3-hydroxyacyl-[acyl-carrier-protein] dehydratase